MRFFNTAGPCVPEDHFMLPAVARLPEVWRLVDRKGYFVLHAPRQSGKTTAMLELARELTERGRYAALMVSAEVGAPFPDDPGKAERAILDSWRGSARAWLPAELQPPAWPEAEDGSAVGAALGAWARAIARPLVLLVDEIDALRGPALVSVLRQLRAGYPTRPGDFP